MRKVSHSSADAHTQQLQKQALTTKQKIVLQKNGERLLLLSKASAAPMMGNIRRIS